MENYVPKIIETNKDIAYGTMLVQLAKCAECGKWMIKRDNRADCFPPYWKLNFEIQVREAGWEIHSYTKKNNKGYICQSCEENGKASFTCNLCEKDYPTTEIQESFGDPSEYLCKSCYKTIPAKKWDKAVNDLVGEHRHDFD